MKKQKYTHLTFTIDFKDFTSDKEIIGYLIRIIGTSLELKIDKKFLDDMRKAIGFKLNCRCRKSISNFNFIWKELQETRAFFYYSFIFLASAIVSLVPIPYLSLLCKLILGRDTSL